jgi:hypothetical protein
MARTLFALFAAAMLIATPAGAQPPQQHLEEARRLLHDVPVPGDDAAAKRVATLQQDFNEFASEYLLQHSRGGTTDTADPGAERQANWRTRYLQVEADLTALLGPADAADAMQTPAASLDPGLRQRLRDIRTHLQTFYAGTIQAHDGNPVAHTGPASNQTATVAPTTPAPQTSPPVRTGTASVQAPAPGGPPSPSPAEARPVMPEPSAGPAAAAQPAAASTNTCPASTAGIDPSTAVQLLDRVRSVLDAVANGESPTSVTAVGTSGTKESKSGAATRKVTIDRGLVDEVRAELTQIRALLKQ